MQIGNNVMGTTVEPRQTVRKWSLAFGLLAAATGRVEWGSTGDIENGNTSHTYIHNIYIHTHTYVHTYIHTYTYDICVRSKELQRWRRSDNFLQLCPFSTTSLLLTVNTLLLHYKDQPLKAVYALLWGIKRKKKYTAWAQLRSVMVASGRVLATELAA